MINALYDAYVWFQTLNNFWKKSINNHQASTKILNVAVSKKVCFSSNVIDDAGETLIANLGNENLKHIFPFDT